MTVSKSPKTPPLSKKTKLLSFDLETNGLHGPAFAVGAVVMGYDGTIHDTFSARCPVMGDIDEWTRQNVLPAIHDMPVTHKTYKALRQAFWEWYVGAESKSDYVLVSNGYPVEYKFLQECQQDDLPERYWQHPFPILDLASLLVMLNKKPSRVSRAQYTNHHPLDDATVTALAAFEAFRQAKRIV